MPTSWTTKLFMIIIIGKKVTRCVFKGYKMWKKIWEVIKWDLNCFIEKKVLKGGRSAKEKEEVRGVHNEWWCNPSNNNTHLISKETNIWQTPYVAPSTVQLGGLTTSPRLTWFMMVGPISHKKVTPHFITYRQTHVVLSRWPIPCKRNDHGDWWGPPLPFSPLTKKKSVRHSINHTL